MVPTKMNPGSPQAQVSGHPTQKNHSRFDLNYRTIGTQRFGEVSPHFVMELVQDDNNVNVRCAHVLRTLPMKSPIFNRMKMHKAYFDVPLQAIIPNNYEKWKVNPVNGQDVPSACGTSVDEFLSKLKVCHDNFLANESMTADITAGTWLSFFRYLVFLNWFGSAGSLLASLEINISNAFRFSVEGYTADSYIDVFMNAIVGMLPNYYQDAPESELFTWTIGSDSYHVFTEGQLSKRDEAPGDISLRDFFYRFMQQPNGTISSTNLFVSDISSYLNDIGIDTNLVVPAHMFVVDPTPVDFRRVHAYNVAVTHFMTNDHIDYIFSAQLYRQNQFAFFKTFCPIIDFTWNGVSYQYDALSGYALGYCLTDPTNSYWDERFSYLANTFNFHRSLRFVDYFTGSRTSPLAVGVTNVAVSGGQVSVIDITKGIQMQRFLNSVNRAGAKFESYMKGVFGVKPAYDFHNPAYLGTTEDDVFSEEIENTSTDMTDNNAFIRSNLKSNAGRFALNFDADRDSVVIGVTYYDLPRYYPFGIPRIVQHLDRFDDFIKEAQYIGDQDINLAELGDVSGGSQPFSYTDRYQEYKIRKSYCYGGMKEFLPTWSYILPNFYQQGHISPDFIRSNCVELDKFYAQLSGYSYAGYFHFIVFNDIACSAVRPMVKHPNIL